MKAFNLLSAILALFLLTVASAKNRNKCCTSCPLGQRKYYSVDKLFNRCGECCMSPTEFLKYKFFEIGLHRANEDEPCYKLGFTEYENTETHGALNIKMTLDKYKKPFTL